MSSLETSPLHLPKLYLVPSAGKDKIPTLASGEVLEGTLLEQLDSRHAVLRIRGQNLLVENQLALPAGEKLRFRVEETEPRVVLRLLPGENPAEPALHSFLKRNLAGDVPVEKLMAWIGTLLKSPPSAWPPEIREGITLLLSFFRRFGLSDPFGLQPSRLKDLLFQSGLFLEHKLFQLLQGRPLDSEKIRKADLKSLLLLLREKAAEARIQNAAGGEGGAVKDLEEGLDQLLQKMEFYQLMNTSPADLRDKIFLLIPLGVQAQPQFVEVGIFLPAKEREEGKEKEVGLLFLLHLPDWGRMRIEVKIRDQALFSQFTLTDPQVAEFIQEGFPALSARFREMGYHGHFQILVEAEENIEPSLFREMLKASRPLFNVVV